MVTFVAFAIEKCLRLWVALIGFSPERRQVGQGATRYKNNPSRHRAMSSFSPSSPFAELPAVPRWRLLLRALLPQGRGWRGGVRLRDHKALSSQTPIRTLALAGCILDIPLAHGRSLAEPCVRIGQRVRKGQVIGRGGPGTVWVHASTSGIVRAVAQCRPADADQAVPCVRIEADGLDEWGPRPVTANDIGAAELATFALQMGLVGLGGAGFPTGLKLAGAGTAPEFLLINGAECEPFVTCDDRLMRERADGIIAAADWLAGVLRIAQVRIGVEPNKPAAIASLRTAVAKAGSRAAVCVLPHRYPAGGQPLLVKSLCGRTLAPGMLPAEIGVMVLNVATVHALGRVVLHGEPLVSRVVTLTGHVEHPGNVEVPIGLPVAALLAVAAPRPDGRGVQVGGPMMGRLLADEAAVVSKTTGCLVVRSDALFPARGEATACIRCNQCVDVCPMALQPLNLFAAAERGDHAALRQEQLGACIECGACSHVCPSNLPLRDSFRQAKRSLGGRP